MKKYKVTIEGIASLLQARHPTPEEEAKILNRKGNKRLKVKDLTDKEQMAMHSYKTKAGKFYQASEMIEAAMTKAAVNFKLEGKKTYKDLMKSGIIVEPVEILHSSTPVMDARWGKNEHTGGAVWVVRPRFDKWKLNFTINLLQDERVSGEILKEILAYAGIYVGIGAWRPKFGRFKITKFTETN